MSEQLAPAPQSVGAPAVVKGSNGLAVAGFVLALLGALTSFIPIVNIGGDLLAALGLIFGIIGLVKSGSRGAGKGLSIAAIILAVAAFAISVVVNMTTVAALNTAVKSIDTGQGTPAQVTGKIGEPDNLRRGPTLSAPGRVLRGQSHRHQPRQQGAALQHS
jgi:membrane-bound ClpP family serine protease